MTATSTDRNTLSRNGSKYAFPVAATTRIPAGVMVALAAGLAVNADATAANVSVGVSDDYADNSAGADGDITVTVNKGVFQFGNSASTDQITLADVGSPCYVVDNQTVAKTSDTGARPVAGLIADVDANGVFVHFI